MNNDVKRLLLWLLAGLVIIGGVLLIIFSSNPTPPLDGNNTPNITLTKPVTLDEWIKGNESGLVTLVEYSDFQCPACAQWYPDIKKIVEEFGSDLQFVYRHYPLSQHLNSTVAAKAAEAAGLQDKFWEMHDKLFETQNDWTKLDTDKAEVLFETYAKELELNIEKYNKDFNSDEVKNQVDDDLSSAIAAKIPGTPSFFLNGIFIRPRSSNEMRNLLLEQLQK